MINFLPLQKPKKKSLNRLLQEIDFDWWSKRIDVINDQGYVTNHYTKHEIYNDFIIQDLNGNYYKIMCNLVMYNNKPDIEQTIEIGAMTGNWFRYEGNIHLEDFEPVNKSIHI